jgi:hypothetical protein
MLPLIACAALLLAGAVVLTSPPTTVPAVAQQFKEEDLTKELEKQRDAGTCKVATAGILTHFFATGNEPRVVVSMQCGDRRPSRLVPKAKEQAMLDIALAAMSTGKSVVWDGGLELKSFRLTD